MNRLRALRLLAAVTTVAALLLLALGGLVTASNSGLGCGPEWPLCQSALVPPAGDVHAWIEGTHRLVAALVSIGVAASAVLAWRVRTGPYATLARRLATVAVGLIIVEVLLGMATVLLSLPPWIVALHMAGAASVVGVMASLARVARAGRPTASPGATRTGYALWAASAGAVATAAMGSYVTHSGAADLCRVGLACIGQIGTAQGSGLVVVATHALLAIVLGALLVAVAGGAGRRLPRLFGLVGVGFVLQALIGIVLLASGLQPALLLVHEFVGSALAAVMIATATSFSADLADIGSARVAAAWPQGSGIGAER